MNFKCANGMPMRKVTDEIVNYVLRINFEDLSRKDVENVKDRLIDVVGCAIGGSYASGNMALLSLIRRWGGAKEATILVHGDKVPVQYAALMNCVMCRSYDFEVCGPRAEGKAAGRMTGHVCSTTELTAFSIAEYMKASGKELITAMVIGGDIAGRIAATEDFSFEHSFDLVGTANVFGATAIAGKLMGLNESQLLNAFGISLDFISGSFQHLWDGVHSFKFLSGLAAYNGIVAAELALEGFTGVKDPLFSRRGYFRQYCKSYNTEFLIEDLGKVFYSKGLHKFFPSCYSNHSAIECALRLSQEHNLNAENIAEVTVVIHPNAYQSFLNQPFAESDSEQKALFNLRYAIANALLRKSCKLEHYTDKFVHDERIIEFVKKIKVLSGNENSSNLSCTMKVKIKSGKELSVHIDTPRGYPERELTRDEIKDKFWRNINYSKAIPENKAKELLESLENLQNLSDVNELIFLTIA